MGARWWADKMRSGFTPDLEADPCEPLADARVVALVGLLHDIAAGRLLPENVDVYEAALAVEIQAIIDAHGTATHVAEMMLRCDYEPGEAHRRALNVAGLAAVEIALPWKTTMWVEPGRVAVRDGLRAEVQDLPLREPR